MNLENDGERMDINYYKIDYNNLDVYQKSHYKRYVYAKSLIQKDEYVADMACGTGYGSMMLSENCKKVDGFDIDEITIDEIKKRYEAQSNVCFYSKNLLDINEYNKYDCIVSFETIEHFTPEEIKKLIKTFHYALKDKGRLIFSTPYDQQQCINSMKYHRIFKIKEEHIKKITNELFDINSFMYQNYDNHDLESNLPYKHFIICVATKK